jgi:glycosyltransferase involved in cell wall biosynthesis
VADLKPGVTVIIPTIPPRKKQLARALRSVEAQTLTPANVIVSEDTDRQGAAVNRDRALFQVDTEWTATLDDDDEFLPFHLARLMRTAVDAKADYVYSFPEMPVRGTKNPIACFNRQPWDPKNPHQTTVVALYRTKIAHDIGGYSGHWADEDADTENGDRFGEDYHFTLKFNEVGKIVHHPEATWRWYHWGKNTSGLSDRW